ncbi:ABC transporter permease subunit [Eubacteriales bacterium OttesenSCG-928-A19]|nr:ABC transporter permease subunit [Eubacteriales bacterium OttesenSCG-928-A19]
MKRSSARFASRILRNYELYIMTLPGLLYLIVFRYVPIAGVQIAFKKFSAVKGIWGSPWIGFAHFEKFFNSYQFERVLTNTVLLSVLQQLISFPIPILLALMLNQLTRPRYKKFVQTTLYAPHFISTVVVVSMLHVFFSIGNGLVNNLLAMMGFERIDFLADPGKFRMMYILSGIWQSMGYNSIIYLAALTSISPDLYEAATVDGATKMQKIINIEIPSILPTAIIMLILAVGRMMSIGFEKAFLMQNARNLATSEIISTYVYKVGLQQIQYDYATAIDLFNGIINLVLICTVNFIAGRVSNVSLW